MFPLQSAKLSVLSFFPMDIELKCFFQVKFGYLHLFVSTFVFLS